MCVYVFIQGLVIWIMYSEAIVVLVNSESHFRVTRSLRFFFLLDIELLHRVRR